MRIIYTLASHETLDKTHESTIEQPSEIHTHFAPEWCSQPQRLEKMKKQPYQSFETSKASLFYYQNIV
jgi:hypothetical protein